MKFTPDFKTEAAKVLTYIRRPPCSDEDAIALIANSMANAYARGGIAACEMVQSVIPGRLAS